MKKEFTPIAMKCNKEQFEAIKPKLKKPHTEINDIENFELFGILVNNYLGKENTISNITDAGINDYKRACFNTWNEKVFLQACGIETEQEYIITKAQLNELSKTKHGKRKVKEWFPEAFETVLEGGKWYKWVGESNFLFLFNGEYGNSSEVSKKNYGFDLNGNWSYALGVHKGAKYTEATESEVFEALKNEAVKRYKDGDYIKGLWNGSSKKLTFNPTGVHKNESEVIYVDSYFQVWMNIGDRNEIVFKEGQWAEIIPTITKAEAEVKLNCKIVD